MIHQIYPRCFKNTTGTERGDLLGITEELPKFASLGGDAIWLSPFKKQGLSDWGWGTG